MLTADVELAKGILRHARKAQDSLIERCVLTLRL